MWTTSNEVMLWTVVASKAGGAREYVVKLDQPASASLKTRDELMWGSDLWVHLLNGYKQQDHDHKPPATSIQRFGEAKELEVKALISAIKFFYTNRPTIEKDLAQIVQLRGQSAKNDAVVQGRPKPLNNQAIKPFFMGKHRPFFIFVSTRF
jgi:hypothetical protein